MPELEADFASLTLFVCQSDDKQAIQDDDALCSPHGRKIIPHFIHLNNVK